MRIPPSFMEQRPESLWRFIDSRGLGTLIHANEEGVEVSHVPILREKAPEEEGACRLEGAMLVAHVARSNPLVDRLEEDARLTVAFLGPSGYISGDWNGESPTVPTWNYMAVNLHGRARVFLERQRILRVLDRIAEVHEPRVGGTWSRQEDALHLSDGLLSAIVGIEFTIDKVEGMFKLHQNAPKTDVDKVVASLNAVADDASLVLAESMQAYLYERH